MANPDHRELVDHLFRQEQGKMVAVLTRIFGFGQLELVEDVVQEAFLSALRSWRTQIPENPSAWLMRAARNRAIDSLRRGKFVVDLATSADAAAAAVSASELFHESEISDSQLRLIFACCHPVLTVPDQIAFTLQLASGFGIREIARALLKPEEAIKKRLQRARTKIKDNNVQLHIPRGATLGLRLRSVLRVLYLTFNEGYHSTASESVLRRDLCAEAMRLTKLICEHPVTNCSDANALLALMCYHAARFDSRVGPDNEIILLADQDRSTWNQELAAVGNQYLAKTELDMQPSEFVLEAAIAAQHVFAPSFEQTPWRHLLTLYNALYTLKPTPLVWLNRAVVVSESGDPEGALRDINRFDAQNFAGHEHLYHCVYAQILEDLGRNEEREAHLERAHEFAPTDAARRLVQRKLASSAG